MLRHDHIAHHARGTAPPHLLQNLQEKIARTHRPQQRPSLATAESDEVQIPSAVIAFQSARHKEQESPPFPNTGKGRAPSCQHSAVKYINGMLRSYHANSRDQSTKGGPPARQTDANEEFGLPTRTAGP